MKWYIVRSISGHIFGVFGAALRTDADLCAAGLGPGFCVVEYAGERPCVGQTLRIVR
jgi:hypothetical protein